MQRGPAGEQVTDFAYDEDSGLLAVGPEPSAVDIITIKYVATTVSKVTAIGGTMKVSDLMRSRRARPGDVFRGERAPDRARWY